MRLQAALGGWHALAVTEEGELYAWGGNENYQASENPQCETPGVGKSYFLQARVPTTASSLIGTTQSGHQM